MPHIHELIDFTASAYVLHPTEPKILLLDHIKLGKWLQPGGHIQLDENPLQALTHELVEETGLTSDDWYFLDQPDQPIVMQDGVNLATLPIPFHINQHHYNNTHQHIDLCYLVKSKAEKITDTPDGAKSIKWCTFKEIKELHKTGHIFDATLDIYQWISNKYF